MFNIRKTINTEKVILNIYALETDGENPGIGRANSPMFKGHFDQRHKTEIGFDGRGNIEFELDLHLGGNDKLQNIERFCQ